MIRPATGLVACTLLLAPALAGAQANQEKEKEGKPVTAAKDNATKEISTPSGLRYVDLQPGEGTEAKSGSIVSVHYTGWLENGTKFDSSRDRNVPFRFKLGIGQVIKGWDEGVEGMKVGGKRRLLIPPKLGYGERGAGGVIPPNADLIFEVELLDVREQS
jgi:FKBP-type peptidyl-prolyl cis-trans isomerase